MNQLINSVNTLVFDLGGVIINLSYRKTYEAFSQLSNRSVEEITSLAQELKEFKQYETGKIGDDAFRDVIRKSIGIKATDAQLDFAWNAMLLDIPMARLNVLLKLKNTHRLFLLSNTNAIHLRAFNAIIGEVSDQHSADFWFSKTYYSHELGMRKPDVEIYNHVLADNKLQANQTLFFDDLLPNIQGASQVGMQTYHVTNADELFEKLDQHQ